MREEGRCERDKESGTALVCCPSHSLRHLPGHVFNISFLRIEGQGSFQLKVRAIEMKLWTTRQGQMNVNHSGKTKQPTACPFLRNKIKPRDSIFSFLYLNLISYLQSVQWKTWVLDSFLALCIYVLIHCSLFLQFFFLTALPRTYKQMGNPVSYRKGCSSTVNRIYAL
jgi:hypothetical protein